MSAAKVVKQLKREVAANKGKASVLGFVCLIAAYYWAPLLGGWFTGEDAKKTANKEKSKAGAAADNSNEPNPNLTSPANPEHAWFDVARWINNDPMMASAKLTDEARNPFWQPKGVEDESDETDDDLVDVEPDAEPDIELDKLGLELKSTLVASARAVVQINDETIKIPIDAQGRPTEVTIIQIDWGTTEYKFVVMKVTPTSVILGRDGKAYKLELLWPALEESKEVTLITKS
jgi:hypothetical protein